MPSESTSGVVIQARSVARVLASASELAFIASDLADARRIASDIASTLAVVQVDASGADLSKVPIEELDVLAGVVWSEGTIWPPGVEGQVRARSEQLRDGVYRVRGGSERDPAELSRA